MDLAYQGPWLRAALLCSSVDRGYRNKITAIHRIADVLQIFIESDPEKEKVTEPKGFERSPVEVDLDKAPSIHIKLLVWLKGSRAPGAHRLQVNMLTPSGEPGQRPFNETFEIASETDGRDFEIDVAFNQVEPGTYWFDILVDDFLLSRVPLTVTIVRD